VSDRIAVMNAGRIDQIGTPEELYLRPATGQVAAFVGVSSLVPGTVVGEFVDVWGQRLPLQTPADAGPVEVFVRPENVRFAASDAPGVDATVQESTFLGSFRRSVVRTTDGTMLNVQHDAGERVQYGDAVRIALDPAPVATRPRD
jgi:putative spermidine/putrescine transport system ATP-binding protein